MVRVLTGDLFSSDAQTWVNTVNCVGVMGKGIALGFKQRFPDMYRDYVARCQRGEVRLGQPYLFRRLVKPWVLNFPTKAHWRSVSKLADIERGLSYLAAHVHEWEVESLAVPPLGCGNGQLDWRMVGPVLYRRLGELGIPVELYAPHGTPSEQLQLKFLSGEAADLAKIRSRATGNEITPGALALVDLLARVERERYRWAVGRTVFQKMAYFATERGIPTELVFEKSSYGPYAKELKKLTAMLINNGLIEEEPVGRQIEVRVGPAYRSARETFAADLQAWDDTLEMLADLFLRMRGRQPEIAAAVHYAAHHLVEEGGNERDVLEAVLSWKQRREPPLPKDQIALAVRHLNLLGWIDVELSPSLVEEKADPVA